MIANVIVLLLVFGYCGLVLYWKHTGVLKDSCSSLRKQLVVAAADALDIATALQSAIPIIWTHISGLRNIDPGTAVRI